ICLLRRPTRPQDDDKDRDRALSLCHIGSAWMTVGIWEIRLVPLSPRPPSLLARSSWPVLAVGGGGVTAIGALAALGAAEPAPALVLATVLGGGTRWQALRVRPEGAALAEPLGPPATMAGPAPPQSAAGRIATLALQGLPDPVMVIAASVEGDL